MREGLRINEHLWRISFGVRDYWSRIGIDHHLVFEIRFKCVIPVRLNDCYA